MEERQLGNIPVYLNSAVISKDKNKCIACGSCLEACEKRTGAISSYLKNKLQNPIGCIACGQCLLACGQCLLACKSHALQVKEDYASLKKAIQDPEKVLIVSLAPECDTLLGTEQMVYLLRKLGADYVFNLQTAYGLMILEQSMSFVKRLVDKHEQGPLMTSFCPVCASFIEKNRPEWLPYLSDCKQALAIQGATLKTYFADKMKLSPESIIIVTVTSCIAQKQQIKQAYLDDAASFLGIAHMKDNDYVISPEELIKWAKEEGIDSKRGIPIERDIHMNAVDRTEFDKPFNQKSDAHLIKNAPGSFTAEVFRHCYALLNHGEMPQMNWIQFKTLREMPHIQETKVVLGRRVVRALVVDGFSGRFSEILDEYLLGSASYDWIELMACPGGCMGENMQTLIKKEAQDIQQYQEDQQVQQCLLDGQVLKALYSEFYETPMSAVSRQLLHRSDRT